MAAATANNSQGLQIMQVLAGKCQNFEQCLSEHVSLEVSKHWEGMCLGLRQRVWNLKAAFESVVGPRSNGRPLFGSGMESTTIETVG